MCLNFRELTPGPSAATAQWLGPIRDKIIPIYFSDKPVIYLKILAYPFG